MQKLVGKIRKNIFNEICRTSIISILPKISCFETIFERDKKFKEVEKLLAHSFPRAID